MFVPKSYLLVAVIGLVPLAVPTEAAAITRCVHTWAVPGEYRVSANFRGQEETTVARLSPACRIYFQIPGVFTGGVVREASECVAFSFKVEGEGDALQATWCGDYAIVPWNGSDLRASVSPVRDRTK